MVGVNTFSFVRLVAIRLGPLPAAHRAKIPFHNGSGFLVYEQLLGLQVFDISIGSARPKPLAALRFGFLNRTDLSAGVPNKPLVEHTSFGKVKRKQQKSSIHAGLRRDGSRSDSSLSDGQGAEITIA